MKLLAMLAVFLALPVYAQTAKVFELTQDEAAQAKQLYAQKAEIEAKIARLHTDLGNKYFKLSNDGTCWTGSINGVPSGTCGVDFEYSEDFRFVVPLKPEPIANWWPSGGYLANGNVPTFN